MVNIDFYFDESFYVKTENILSKGSVGVFSIFIDYLKLCVLYKSELHISTAGKNVGIIIIKDFSSSINDVIVHIINQIGVSRVPL